MGLVQEQISIDTLEEFQRVTGYDIVNLFDEFNIFIDEHRPRIASYFKGEIQIPNAEAFDFLDSLKREFRVLINKVENFSSVLSGYEYWILQESIEDMRNVLDTTSNLSRIYRSSESLKNFNSSTEVELTLKSNETIEAMVRKRLNSDDFDYDWLKIAIDNDLKEEDYDTKGGKSLKVSFQNSSSIFLNSVIDNLDGDKIYGKDILQKITFDEDLSDLMVLSPEDTLRQSVSILSNLQKGGNPQFPSAGYDKYTIVGGNINTLNFTSLFRQIVETFQRDDTISSVEITDIRREQTAVYVDYIITTVREQQVSSQFIVQ